MFGRCPKCGSAEVGPDGICDVCGFPAGQVNAFMLKIYLITGAFAASVLIYGVIGYAVMSSTQTSFIAPSTGRIIFGALVVVGISSVVVAYKVLPLAFKRPTPAGVLQIVLFTAALCEAPAIYGLVVGLLTRNAAWMAALIALSLAGFVLLSRDMPAVAQRITELVAEKPDALDSM